VQVDQVPEEKDDIAYATVKGAFQYMWNMALGELAADDYMFSKTNSDAT
jgi:hypothetical protein